MLFPAANRTDAHIAEVACDARLKPGEECLVQRDIDTHTYTHAQTQSHTRIRTHARTHARSHARTHANFYLPTTTHDPRHTHTHVCASTHARTEMGARECACRLIGTLSALLSGKSFLLHLSLGPGCVGLSNFIFECSAAHSNCDDMGTLRCGGATHTHSHTYARAHARTHRDGSA